MLTTHPKRRLTREVILEEAAELFRELSYDRTTLKAVGKRLGVSGAALYYHFQTKEEILFALLRDGLQAILQETQDSMTGQTPSERLSQLVQTYVLFALGELPNSRMYAAGVYDYFHMVKLLDKDCQDKLRRLQREYLRVMRSTIREGIAAGEFDLLEEQVTALAISGLAMNAFLWYRPDKGLTAQEVAETCAALALRMVGVKQ
jgi:AcrR family transcriptional regulator